MNMGRKKLYKEEFNDQARVACQEGGFTDAKLGKLFGVKPDTIYSWKKEYPAFARAVQDGKDAWDSEKAERSLAKRVTGFFYTEVTRELRPIYKEGLDGKATISGSEMVVTKRVKKYVVPDVGAIALWLKNRRRDRWKDYKAIEISGPDGKPMEQNVKYTKDHPPEPATLEEWHRQSLRVIEGGKAKAPQDGKGGKPPP
jgi:hypothetical protein